MRPRSRIRPLVGRRMPAITFSIVDLPDPLGPINASVPPCGTSKETSRSAQKSSARVRPDSSRCLSDVGFSR